MSLRLLSPILLLIGLAPPAAAQLTTEQAAEDLDLLLQEWLPKNRALDDEARTRARSLLDEARESASELDGAAFALTVMRAAALSGNGHNMAGFGLLDRMPRLPIRIWWFEDGLFVTKTDRAHADLLGARIDGFGGASPAEALAAAAPYLSGNGAWRRHRSVEFLTRAPLLEEIGLGREPAGIAMAFTDPDGQAIERILTATEFPDPEDDTLRPWRESLFRLAGSATDGSLWPHILDGLEARPAFLRSDATVSYELLETMPAGYVRLAEIRDPEGPGSLRDALFGVLASVERDRPENLIIDLRHNTGGNFFNAVPFAFGIGHLVPQDGRIFLLANRTTFSAAIVTMAMIVHQAGRGRVTIVGEPIGDELRFWSEGGYVTLPHSRILVTYNDGLHDMVDGCQPDEGCWWGAAAFEHGVGNLDPDIPIRQTFEDYVSGRDLYLEAVQAELAGDER